MSLKAPKPTQTTQGQVSQTAERAAVRPPSSAANAGSLERTTSASSSMAPAVQEALAVTPPSLEFLAEVAPAEELSPRIVRNERGREVDQEMRRISHRESIQSVQDVLTDAPSVGLLAALRRLHDLVSQADRETGLYADSQSMQEALREARGAMASIGDAAGASKTLRILLGQVEQGREGFGIFPVGRAGEELQAALDDAAVVLGTVHPASESRTLYPGAQEALAVTPPSLELLEALSPRLQEFHFDLGNSSEGPIGFCAVIKAADPSEALAILKRALPESVSIEVPRDHPDRGKIDYIQIYLNPNAVQESDIDDVEEVGAED